MSYYLVYPLKQTHAKEAGLTYSSPAGLQTGSIVEVEVGRQVTTGIVMRTVPKPEFKTKAIGRNLTDQPLPPRLLELANWLSDYYKTHPSVVLKTMLPRGLTKSRRQAKKPTAAPPKRQSNNFKLTEIQATAVKNIWQRGGKTSLIRGVTGSGKTAIYLELARRTVQAGQSVIIIVPEIALTSQLIAEFSQDFPGLSAVHSNQTEATRHQTWLKQLASDQPQVVIGPRSALFSPVKNLGLIVIDECHEPSLIQEKSPRYSALRAAAILAKSASARLVMGSATPSVADYYLASQSDPDSIIELDKPARSGVKPADLTLVDLTRRTNFSSSRILSKQLLDALGQTRAGGEQALLFHNRRGSASLTLCENCGWTAICPNCDLPLTLHADKFTLRCHVCGLKERVPTTCPDCGQTGVVHKGIGTKRIEAEVTRLFPDAKVARFDGDNQSDETLDKLYQQIYDGDVDIIIGTQVVAKGLDLPKLGLVGVVQADAGLNLPDFTAEERTFQLLAQVVGRVGRTDHSSQVIVQSFQPDHPSVKFGLKQNYQDFYDYVLKKRLRDNFPPACFLLKLTCVYKTEAAAVAASHKLADKLRPGLPAGCQIFGPAPAFYERASGTFRWQLIIKSKKRRHLMDIVDQIPPGHWQTDLDPPGLL